ncbi:MAG: imidazolonepropionase [Bacteroidota bacterium]
MKILIKNIKELVQIEEKSRQKVSGKEMAQINTIKNAWLSIEDDIITDFGNMDDCPVIEEGSSMEVINATGKMVFPCWCDPHTHLVYAGSREGEFVDRIKGLTYEEIAQRGGGILNSAKRLQNTPEGELTIQALERINEIEMMGTGAVEIKSGYGLTVESEIKMLRVIKKLKELSPLTIKATFLAAHAIPAQYKDDHKGYIDLIINEMLPIVKDEGLADYIDVFCETGYFSAEETDRILQAGTDYGLKPKIHVNQFTSIGGVQVGLKHNALSLDHLEVTNKDDIIALKEGKTIPTLLPSCSFFLNIPYAPARELIDSGLPVALATDYNPGSTPSGNIPFVISLACIKMRMTPEEAINAATINAAYAMGLSETHGSIARGKKANVFITKGMPSYTFLPYAFGSDLVERVIVGGDI